MAMRLYEGMTLREISEYLFCEDEPTPGDLILVFGGKRLERAERAAELYHAGMAPRVFITGGDKRGIGVCEAERLRDHMIKLGVPAEVIEIECKSVNTIENVRFSVEQIEKSIGWKNIKNVLLVSSPYHMRRVKRTIANYIPRETKITCCPDRRTDVTRDNWWHTEEGKHLIIREMEKVRTYALRGDL